MSDSPYNRPTQPDVLVSGSRRQVPRGKFLNTALIVALLIGAALAGYTVRGSQDTTAIAAATIHAQNTMNAAENMSRNAADALSRTASPSPDSDFYADYRRKDSYGGEVGTAQLRVQGTYYMPNTVFLSHTGNAMWFIRPLTAPLLSNAADAGPYPFTIKVITQPQGYQFSGGAGLEITLPTRADFLYVYYGPNDSRWSKDISRAEDVRDPAYYHESMIAVSSVLAAPGLKIEDYYSDYPGPATLPVGHSGYVYASEVKQVEGSSRGYVRDWIYLASVSSRPLHDHFVKLTHTVSGFTACTTVLGVTAEVYVVPSTFVPQQTDLKVTFDCSHPEQS